MKLVLYGNQSIDDIEKLADAAVTALEEAGAKAQIFGT